jgi:miniconductance mechanosensitive channel
MYGYLLSYLTGFGLSKALAIPATTFLCLLSVFIIAFVIHKTLAFLFVKRIDRYLKNHQSVSMPFVSRYHGVQKVFSFIPIFILFIITPIFLDEGNNPYYKSLWAIFSKALYVYLYFKLGSLINTFIHVGEKVYKTKPISNRWPISTYTQTVKIIIYGILAILAVSTIVGKSPSALLAGLGFASGITMLVFKDAIMSFAANFQISSLNIMKVGDWIEIPNEKISGTVKDISLSIITIENFDKTISTVPPVKIVNNVVKNWAGMEESGGRRFTPTLLLDTNKVVALTPEKLKEYQSLPELEEYIKNVSKRPEKHTNLGAYRHYALNYLRADDRIHSEGFTILARLLEANNYGYLPLQIYAFTKTTDWGEYENIQDEIIEHLISIAPKFDLEIIRR